MSDLQYTAPTSGQNEQDALLSEILQRFSATSASSAPPPPTPPPTQATNAPPRDMLSSLLSNPDFISKLPQMISAIKPLMDVMGKPQGTAASSPASEGNIAATSSTPAYPAASARAKSESDRAALLCAMKPYLSHNRQNAVDYIIKLSRLGDILKTL